MEPDFFENKNVLGYKKTMHEIFIIFCVELEQDKNLNLTE